MLFAFMLSLLMVGVGFALSTDSSVSLPADNGFHAKKNGKFLH